VLPNIISNIPLMLQSGEHCVSKSDINVAIWSESPLSAVGVVSHWSCTQAFSPQCFSFAALTPGKLIVCGVHTYMYLDVGGCVERIGFSYRTAFRT